MKYNQQLSEAGRVLPQAKNILIALPANPSVDILAAALALYLSLQQIQRPSTIVSDGPVLVGHTNLFGVGQILNKLPATSGGNYVLTLVGVANPADPDKPIPSVERMDYKTEGADLKLVFNIIPGQRFEPQAVVPSFDGGNFDLVFVVGAPTLNALGNIYNSNQGAFSGSHIVNIDNQPHNSQYGATNVVDPAVSSLSEMVAQVLPGLALPMEGDIATNILNGIFVATQELQSGNVNADTYLVIAEAMRAGGQRPVGQSVSISAFQNQTTAPQPTADTPILRNAETPAASLPSWAPASSDQQAMNQAFAQAFSPATAAAIPQAETPPASTPSFGGSPEERPAGEGVIAEGETVNPEPDWLIPKVFKGGNIG